MIHFKKITTVRGPVPIVEESLSDRNRIPLKTHIVGRFKHLAITTKGRQRLKTISKELNLNYISAAKRFQSWLVDYLLLKESIA